MSRPFIRSITLLGILAATACREGITEPLVSGSYDLSHVGGIAIPASIPGDEDNAPFTATGGMVTLNANKTWRAEVAVLLTQGEAIVPANRIFSGTYVASRDTMYFREASNGSVIPAVMAGSTLTARVDNISYVFERR